MASHVRQYSSAASVMCSAGVARSAPRRATGQGPPAHVLGRLADGSRAVGKPGRRAPQVHKNVGSGRSILRMSGGPEPEPERESGGGSGAARASLASLSPSRLREWLPGVFAARLLRGVQLPGGRIVGETDRVVHLFPIPAGRIMPEQLRAFCGLVIRPGQAELVTVGTGMPCVACVVAAPDPEPT